MIESEGLAAWLRLTLIPGIGGETQRKLLAAFGLPEAVFSAGRLAARAVVGSRADLLFDFDPAEAVDRSMAWANEPGQSILTLADSAYPRALLEIADPPNVLYVRGNPGLLQKRGLGIVGSRNATPQGLQTAEVFAKALAGAGLSIISGLALGIDAAAHRGALAAGGDTIAVIGTGADRLYPARNKELAQAVLAMDVLRSDMPTLPADMHLPEALGIFSRPHCSESLALVNPNNDLLLGVVNKTDLYLVLSEIMRREKLQ